MLRMWERSLNSQAWEALSYSDEVAAIEELIRRGLDIDERDELGLTLLRQALSLGRIGVAKLLLAKGVDTSPDRKGYTPLHHAVRGDRDDTDIMAELLDRGADINARTLAGRTPLAYCHSLKTCEFLLERGAQINVSWKDGTVLTPYLYEFPNSNKEILSLLLQRGADVHLRDGRGQTAMHHAALLNADAVRTLLKHGAEINAIDNSGQTPLHKVVALHANEGRHGPFSSDVAALEEAINTLIEAGASLTIRDNRGRTPRDLAEEIAISKVPVCQLLAKAESQRGVPESSHVEKAKSRGRSGRRR